MDLVRKHTICRRFALLEGRGFPNLLISSARCFSHPGCYQGFEPRDIGLQQS